MHRSFKSLLGQKCVMDEWTEEDDRRRTEDNIKRIREDDRRRKLDSRESGRSRGNEFTNESPTGYKNMRLKENIPREERDMLLKKVLLHDGSKGDVITCYKTKNIWRYICHVCNVSGLVWNQLLDHKRSWRHEENLSEPSHPKDKFLIFEGRSQNERSTTEDRDSVMAVCKIQRELDNCSKPLIGLEYLLEIVSDWAEPAHYYCLLCDKASNPSYIINHLITQSHQSQYLTKFFRKAAVKLDLYNKFGSQQNQELFCMLTEHVVAKIEHVLGRLKPIQIQHDTFEKNKRHILDKIERGTHLKETLNHSFVECVDITHLNPNHCSVGWNGQPRPSSLKQGENKIKPLMETIVDPPREIYQDDSAFSGNANYFDRMVSGRSPGNDGYDRRQRSIDHMRAAGDDRLRLEDRIQDNSVESPVSYARFEEEERRFYEYTCSNTDSNLWQNYLERVQLIEVNLLEEMRYYQETPEKHPKYHEEWKEYWNKRYDELIAMGEDPRNYDIKVEWNAFWEIRLNELYKEIFEKEKAQLRQQLQFLQTDNNGALVKMDERKNYENVLPIKRAFESDSDYGKSDKTKKLMRSLHDDHEESSKQTSHVSVISVLRQLSVLEHNLGSLGPKVVDLLSTALKLEKSSKNGADTILKAEEHVVLLETVKEKLKGFLQSGLLEETMITVTEAAICSVIDLLSSASKKEKSLSRDRQSHLSSDINKPYSFEKKSDPKILGLFTNERKSFFNELKSSSSNERSRFNKRPQSNERRPCSTERRPCSNERRSCSNERRPCPNERRPRSNERRPWSNERRPRSNERRPRSNERRPRSNERKPCSSEKRPHPNERRPHSSERRLHPNERKRHSIEKKQYSNKQHSNEKSSERRFFSNEKRPRFSNQTSDSSEQNFNERKSRSKFSSNEEKLCSNDSNLYLNKSFGNKTVIYNKDAFIAANQIQNQNCLTPRILKVSEINLYVDKLGILSHLTFIQRAAIAQQIASMLLLRRVTDITEDELLLLMKTLLQNSTQNNVLNYIPQLVNQYSSSSIQFSSERDLSDGARSTLPSLLNTSTLNSTYITNVPYEQSTTFLESSGNKLTLNSSQMNKYSTTATVTYPLNENPYRSGDRRKY